MVPYMLSTKLATTSLKRLLKFALQETLLGRICFPAYQDRSEDVDEKLLMSRYVSVVCRPHRMHFDNRDFYMLNKSIIPGGS